jgi:hypothetical protein
MTTYDYEILGLIDDGSEDGRRVVLASERSAVCAVAWIGGYTARGAGEYIGFAVRDPEGEYCYIDTVTWNPYSDAEGNYTGKPDEA